jgi:hypothetical protein
MLLVLWILPALIIFFVILIYIYIRLDTAGQAAVAQRWKDRFVPMLLFGVAFSLVYYSVLARAEEGIAPSQENNTLSITTNKDEYTLFILYPRTIHADTVTNSSPELVLWLKNNGNVPALNVTVEFSSTIPFTFTDSTGTPVALPLSLTADNTSRQQRLVVQFLPISDMMEIEIKVSDENGQSETKKIGITYETQTAFFWRTFRNFVSDEGLGLAAASAVLGIGWQIFSERRQERLAQQSERIREIRDLFERDLVEWHLATETPKQEESRHWEDQTRSELEKTIKDQRQKLTSITMKERVIHLLQDAAGYYRAGDDRRLKGVFELLKLAQPEFRPKTFSEPGSRQQASDDKLKLAQQESRSKTDLLLLPPVYDQQSAKTTLDICANILQHFQMNGYELVIAMLERLASHAEGRQYLLQFISENVTSSNANVSDMREVIKLASNDPRIRQHLVDELPPTYAWPLFTPPHPKNIVRPKPITDWLEVNELSINPFDLEELQGFGKFWESIELTRNQQHATIVASSKFDCYIAAFALYNELRKPNTQCLPFLVFLSDFDPITCGSLIHFIGRKAGEYWCTALARQPETILWLLEDEQILLAEWMIWVSGSLPALRRTLRNQSLQNQSSQSQGSQDRGSKSDVVRQIVLHLLDRLLSNATPKIPDARTVLDWLTICPLGIKQMHLIVIDDTGDDRARQLTTLMHDLQRAGLTCTLFTTSMHTGKHGHSESIRLRWTEKDLLSLLDSTVVIVSEQKQSLLGLIELGNSATNKEEFVTEILKRAHGSFALSLIIFQHALERHLVLYRDQNDPAYSLLQENDFR